MSSKFLVPLLLLSCAHASSFELSSPRSLSESGPLEVGTLELELKRGDRPLPSTVWYPRGAAPAEGWPLIVYSHGFMSSRMEGAGVVAHLASHGYVVIAADYPKTGLASKPPILADVEHQPADVSFLIDAVLAMRGPPFGRVDAQRIGVTGVSLGGLTTLLTAFHPTLKDPRIRAAVAMAAPSEALTPTFFTHAQVPLLAIYGTADLVIDYRANGRTLPRKDPRAWLASIETASHSAFADLAQYFGFFLRNPDTFGCAALKANLPPSGVDPFAPLHTADGDVEAPAHPHVPCTTHTVPLAMRPSDQQVLTRALVLGFFEAQLGPDEARRHQARVALTELPATQPRLHLELP